MHLIFNPEVHKFLDSIRTIPFQLGYVTLTPLASVTEAHFRSSFTDAEATMTEMILNNVECHSRWPLITISVGSPLNLSTHS
jgi:hypothetical protein